MSGNTFVSENSPAMRGAVITVNADNSRTLRQKDGSILTFNPSGRLVQQEDRNGNKILIDRDGGGKILTVREPSGRSLTFTYDGANRVTSITDPLGRRVTYHYNAAGRLDIATDPAGGETHYSYDVNNRMATITDARGIAYLQSEYDLNGRVIRQINADGGEYRYMYFGPNGLALLSVPIPRVGLTSGGCGGRIIVLQPGAPVPGGCVVTPGPGRT